MVEGEGGARVRHYYRLVYWKRRLLGAGRRSGSVPRAYGQYGRGSRAADRRATVLRIRERTRPVLVFAVIVGIVLVASALLGSLGGPGGLR
ncbi:hypothetical protein N566_11460 [Streptomycetaceae bacterium MP113-05]|nr:hypothetical protein N566_11460 [Streptomycetaceae bacterium MP113-05]